MTTSELNEPRLPQSELNKPRLKRHKGHLKRTQRLMRLKRLKRLMQNPRTLQLTQLQQSSLIAQNLNLTTALISQMQTQLNTAEALAFLLTNKNESTIAFKVKSSTATSENHPRDSEDHVFHSIVSQVMRDGPLSQFLQADQRDFKQEVTDLITLSYEPGNKAYLLTAPTIITNMFTILPPHDITITGNRGIRIILVIGEYIDHATKSSAGRNDNNLEVRLNPMAGTPEYGDITKTHSAFEAFLDPIGIKLDGPLRCAVSQIGTVTRNLPVYYADLKFDAKLTATAGFPLHKLCAEAEPPSPPTAKVMLLQWQSVVFVPQII